MIYNCPDRYYHWLHFSFVGALHGLQPALQVFNVFNRVIGFFARSSRIEFDDDWEEKSELASNGLRLLTCATPAAPVPLRQSLV